MAKSAQEAVPAAQRGGPPVDIVRSGNHLLLQASLPGVKPADLRVAMVGDRQLFFEGRVAYQSPVPQESLALNERAYGPFSRTVDLPMPVDVRAISVTFTDGVLTVQMPIRAQQVELHWQAKEGGAG